MRPRINKNGLISHNTPNGKSKLGERELLRKKFLSGDITKEELRKYANFLMVEKKKAPTHITINVFGGTLKLTIEEYNTYYKSAFGNM